MGLPVLEWPSLTDLAQTRDRLNRWEYLLTTAAAATARRHVRADQSAVRVLMPARVPMDVRTVVRPGSASDPEVMAGRMELWQRR